MSEPLVTAEEFMEKYAHRKIELVDGRVTLSGRPIHFEDGRMYCPVEKTNSGSGCVLRKPPQLCVEVRSPSNTWNEIFIKVGEYLGVGVVAVLVLDPDRLTASVYRQDGDQQIFRADDDLTLPDVLPGFSVPVRRFFA